MNSFAGLVVFAALVAATTRASPCTDTCNAECAAAKQSCALYSSGYEGLCNHDNDVCTRSCKAACDCKESCSNQCSDEFVKCKKDNGNIGGVISCVEKLSECSSNCQEKCDYMLFTGVPEKEGDAKAEDKPAEADAEKAKE